MIDVTQAKEAVEQFAQANGLKLYVKRLVYFVQVQMWDDFGDLAIGEGGASEDEAWMSAARRIGCA